MLASSSHGPDDGQREENHEREPSEEDEYLLELLDRRWAGERFGELRKAGPEDPQRRRAERNG